MNPEDMIGLMMPEGIIEMMLQSILPFKFDMKIRMTAKDKEDLEFNLKGDVFTSRLKGDPKDRIFIALEIPEEGNP